MNDGNEQLEGSASGAPARGRPVHLGPPRCRACGYVLQGLDGVHLCPECSEYFDLRDPRTYIRHAPYVPSRFWAPGVILAAAFIVASIPFMALGLDAWGWSLFLALPGAGGAMLGYRLRVSKFVLPMLGVLLALAFLAGVGLSGLGGIFCMLILLGFLLVPIFVGIGAGALLRIQLKRLGYDQATYLPLLLIGTVPYLCVPIDKWTTSTPAIATMATVRIIDAPAEDCWQGLVFYEEVTHPPPWILRVGLARPLASRGPAFAPGDHRVCVYKKGRICKRIARVEPGRLLAFNVTEQQIGYERDILLRSGSFEFEAIDGHRTRVTLTSTYQPLLTPRWCWGWGERIAFRTLHGYVLEGIARNAERREGPARLAAGDAP